jgi:hypothetical protein
MMAGMLLAARASTSGGLVPWLAAAAVISLAPLIRYIGIGLPVIAALLFHLAASDASTTRVGHFRRTAVFLAASFAPFVVWVVWCLLGGQRPTGRSLDVHPLLAANLALLTDTLATWGVPQRVTARAPWLFRSLVCLALGLLWASIVGDVVRAARATGPRGPSATLRLAFGLLTLLYVPVLLVAATLLDPFIAFDFRLLSPMFVPALLVVVERLWPKGPLRLRVAEFGGLLLLILLASSNAVRTASWLKRAHEAGNGYERPAYRSSRLLAAARSLPPQHVLISNDPIMLYTHTGRVSARVPGVSSFQDRLRAAGEAHVIYFCGRTTLPPLADLAPSLSFRTVFGSECPAYATEPSIFAWPPDAALAEGVLYRYGTKP